MLHSFQPISVSQLPTPFTMRGCTIRNCVIGAKGLETGGITLRGSTVENCQLGLQNAHAFNTLISGNIIGGLGRCIIRFSDFIDNAYDVAYFNTGSAGNGMWIATGTLYQNYWGENAGVVKTGPTVALVEQSVYTRYNDAGEVEASIESTQTISVYSSPYYLDKAHSKLSVDLDKTQVMDSTAVLPLQQPESGQNDSLVLTAEAFTLLQNAKLGVNAPHPEQRGQGLRLLDFPTITDGSIETDLNLSDQLPDKAQSTVDKLPEADRAKILQEVNLSHNGALPGRATIRIKATEVPGDDVSQLYLYWVKEDGTIVPAEVVEVKYDAETNEYIITVDHCSEYVITSGELTQLPAPTTNPGGGSSGGTTGGSGGSAATPAPTAAPTATPVSGGQTRPTATPNEATSGNSQDELFSAQQVMDSFAAQTGDVVLRLNNRTQVSQTAFELLMQRQQGVLRLDGGSYAWVFDRADLTDTQLPGGVFDTEVSFDLSQSILDRIRSYTGDAPVAVLDTAFSGQLPGKATLEITVDATLFGSASCGLFYLPETGDPERVATVEVAADGLAKLPLEHCSVYYLVVEEAPVTEPAPEVEQEAPAPADPDPVQPQQEVSAQGGSSAVPLVLGGLVLVVVIVAVFFIARRRKE